MRMGELGAATYVQPPSMSVTTARMEKLGLITRSPDPADSRAWLVQLTDAGWEAMARVLPVHRAWLDQATAVLSADECVQLQRLLNRLADHLGALGADGTKDRAGAEGCEASSD